ncbi:acidic repeat-containing protein [Thalassophryne amazonica]|uniref:acidic repeat-containing protein n=1 Tax=Thalassophryne amazonica TaxID=390379 RepID=UPI001470C8A2|nr:acidic repeat-containing protein [Thalassophryne amazonica]
MNDDTNKLLDRVAKKMGWTQKGAMDRAEEKLINAIGKTRHAGTSDREAMDPTSAFGSEEDPEKENQGFTCKALIVSSDDDSDNFLFGKATPRLKTTSQKPRGDSKKDSVQVVSSDSDDSFEKFLTQMKTPKAKPLKASNRISEDSLKNFIVADSSSDDDFIVPKSSSKVVKNSNPPASQHRLRTPLSQWVSPIFVSDSDGEDDDNIVIKSSWRTCHPPPKVTSENAPLCDQAGDFPSPYLPPVSLLFCQTPASLASTTSSTTSKRTVSAPSNLEESTSSEEEFTSLLERLKQKNKLIDTPLLPKKKEEGFVEPALKNLPTFERRKAPGSSSLGEMPLDFKSPGKCATFKPTVSQTEPRHGPSSRIAQCKTPGCFLQCLLNPDYSRSFKQNKEELTNKLYRLYNNTVFDNKLPINMSLTWNKKMRKTAGYCVTGQERGGGSRYAKIELSEKVCDSAERLRDTLIHEMCHAATWLINGVRDGHGNLWKLYAKKATLMHPELPLVTRCHSYDIKYKYQYQCTRCQNTIGRHSKSLDTQRFVCACCKGQLVLLTPSKPRTPTPFANFVKENYGSVRQELAGQSHAEVMRKLSVDFATKTRVSQS